MTSSPAPPLKIDILAAEHPLLSAARSNPSAIDSLLSSRLRSATLPTELANLIEGQISLAMTPSLYGTGSPHRPPWYYATCLVHATLLGRAYALLSTPTRPPKDLSNLKDFPFPLLPAELRLQIYEHYLEDLEQREKYWKVMTTVFIKALWSGCDPEEGSRYITGILLLTCGNALAPTPNLQGRGKGWVWWDDRISEPENVWSWEDLKQAVMNTEKLPRGNTNIIALRERWERVHEEYYKRIQETGTTDDFFEEHRNWDEQAEYVSAQVLEVLDVAREHLRAGERDWTPAEIMAKFLNQLFEGREDARTNWEAAGESFPNRWDENDVGWFSRTWW